MFKTEFEKIIESYYEICHIPILCKNNSYADSRPYQMPAEGYYRTVF